MSGSRSRISRTSARSCSRLRAAVGRDHHGAGQPLHLSGPPLDLHADPDAGRGRQGQPVTRWAIVAPNYEYGQSAAANFKRLIKEANPKAEIVAEQYPALGRVEAGATVNALAQARRTRSSTSVRPRPRALRARGKLRGLFEGRLVASLLTGEPEYMLPLGDETPEGWIVTGYPGTS
jgi:hypothetical protein